MRAFLAQSMPVVLSTTRQGGSVQSVPVWYELVGDEILVNGGPTRAWLRHLQRDPRVTLLFMDLQNMFRWAQVQGRLVGVADDPGPRADLVTVRIAPERVTGGDNRQPWDAA